MKKLIVYLLVWTFSVLWFGFLWTNVYAQQQDEPKKTQCGQPCSWIKLNTCFLIIWDCIETKKDASTNATNAFPRMMWVLTQIVMSLVLVVCFILIIYAGILWSADNPKEAKKWLTRVAITILLLWFSGVILKLINPNFFS